jgi:hypothetical protein
MFSALQFGVDEFAQASADVEESKNLNLFFRRDKRYVVRPSQTWKNPASVVWQRTETGFKVAAVLFVGR